MASQRIPIICDCGTVSFTGSFVRIQGASRVHMRENLVRCPKCSGWARVPDGIYTEASIDLFDPEDARIVIQALEELLELSKRADAEQVRQAAEKSTVLKGIARFLPKNPTELIAYLALVISLLNSCHSSSPPASTVVKVEIQDGIHAVASDLKSSPAQRPTQPHR